MKRGKLSRFKPAVSRRTLLLIAGLVWIGVGIVLLSFAARWLGTDLAGHGPALIVTGVAAALLIHHVGFLRVVDKNLGRILPMRGQRCIFSFISWKSYLLVGVMMTIGVGLRHSSIPKPYLGVLYLAIGLALILSSVRYLRVLLLSPRR